MHSVYKYILFTCFILSGSVRAQNNWPSPEVEQMYNTARNYMTNGNLQQAIVTYRQAIQVAPDQMILHRDLGRAYYLSGNSQQAEEILEPILKSGEADEQTFQIMASIQGGAGGDKKKARSILLRGIGRYPNSGILHHDMGKLYEDDNEPEKALASWLDGIQKDPGYHVNYYEAARMYLMADKPVWTIIYGEIFVNIEQFTARSQETREMLLSAYKKIYYTAPAGEIPKYSKNAKVANTSSFESAVLATLMKLSPVVGDGVNTENLIMVRTRFVMEWITTYGNKYPTALFNFHDNMLRSGYFDAYNQWLFGKAENASQYEAWLKFHEKAMPEFLAWQQQNKFTPTSGDFYNTKQVQGLFERPAEKKDKKDSKR